MPAVKVTVMIEVDGEPLKGFPLVKRFEPVDRDSFDATLATSASFVAFPGSSQVASTQALFFQAVGAAMAIRLDGTVDSEVSLNRGGFVLVVDSGGFTDTTVQNNSGGAAKAQGFRAGT